MNVGQDQQHAIDARMMERCIALAHAARARGELPYAAVISEGCEFVCESPNMARAERDATRHAETVTISLAQRARGTVNLDACTLYSLVEPCAMCAYAIRETRIQRVVYGLKSPAMGGHTRWNILGDRGLSAKMPEAFAEPPTIVAGFMQEDVAAALRAWDPLFWEVIRARGLLVPVDGSEPGSEGRIAPRRFGLWERARGALRAATIDRLWRT
jgi:tRNA(adenine34) deaminase